jgi:hypothetical protein
MSGLELIRKIRIRQPEIKIILITALMPEDRLVRQKDEVHPDIFIRKPLSVSNFLEAVDSLIGPEQVETPPVEKTPPADIPQPVEKPHVEISEELEEAVSAVLGQAARAKTEEQEQDLPASQADLFPQKPVETEPMVEQKSGEPFLPPAEPALPGLESIASVLTRLKGNLGALAVLLIDEQGNLVAGEGNLPVSAFEEKLLPAALASLKANVVVSDLLGTASSGSVQAFQGTDYDLVLAPAGRHSLFIFLKTGRSALRLAIALEEALHALEDLVLRLTTLGLVAQLVNEPSPQPESLDQSGVTKSLSEEEIESDLEIMDPDLKKLEDLFSDQKPGNAAMEDSDSFWETASGTEGKDANPPGILSYDEAQELGLIKPDEEE